MADVNREYLLEQFRLAEEYLGRVRGIASLSRDAYLLDKNAVDASVRQLTVLFETCHNIGKHLISRHEWRSPESKAETFEILAEQGVLPEDLIDAFRGASRFRNLVTYQTIVIQDELVYDILQGHLADFERFLSSVARWLGSGQAG
ncbi:MAG TPA: DUF86 domain-containing protein [Thermoanaerobaculia bacterium]|nr:DUF86 domain-containing protein [Thermoanaerobaculia bacterium]